MDLCRYVSFRRFCEMVFFQQLTLIPPKKWNDKYENYILSIISKTDSASELKKQLQGKNSFTEEQAEDFIQFAGRLCSDARCICFSSSIDEEVMWNAYNYNRETIMWETTDERIEKINPKFDLAPVQYDLEEMGLRGFLHQFVTYKGKAAIIDAHKLFCHKRSIFSYENEIRVIDVESINSTTEKCSFHIASLPDFIEGVMVHPLAEDEYVKLVEEICNHFNIAFLGKSQIYEMKEIY